MSSEYTNDMLVAATYAGGSTAPVHEDVLIAASYANIDPVPSILLETPHRVPGASIASEMKDESVSNDTEQATENKEDVDMQEKSSSDEDDSESEDEDQTKLRDEIEKALKKEEQGSLSVGHIGTTHEVPFKQLPVKKPTVELTPECPIAKMGRILNVNAAENAITIQSIPNQYPLDEGSVLCLPNRIVLGCVDEVFGPVSLPLYLIRFETADEIPPSAQLHTDVFYATEHATYVEPEKCRIKGSDASNLYDEEPGADEVEYSDDEAEQTAKRKRKRAPKQQTNSAPSTSAHSQPRQHYPQRSQQHQQYHHNNYHPPQTSHGYPDQHYHSQQFQQPSHHPYPPQPHHPYAGYPPTQAPYYPPQPHGYSAYPLHGATYPQYPGAQQPNWNPQQPPQYPPQPPYHPPPHNHQQGPPRPGYPYQ